MKSLPLATFLAVVACPALAADVVVPTAESLTLTLSQGSDALIYDQRTAELPQGPAMLRWDGVSPTVVGGSIMLQIPDTTVQEQALQTTTLSTATIREAYVGRDVTVFWTDDPTHTGETLKLLSAKPPLLFQRGTEVLSGEPARIVYGGQIPDLSPLPSLQARLAVAKAGPRAVNLTYLSGGLRWQANYTARYDGWQQLEISSWANLSNRTGLDFPAATIRLLAGEQSQSNADSMPRMMAMAAPAAAKSEAGGISRQTVGGVYHLYTLPDPLALNNGQERQVPLLPVSTLTVKRQLVLNSDVTPYNIGDGAAPAQNPDLELVLTNTLDQPLPAGTVRIFQKDEQNNPVFMGSDSLPNLPVGEKATVSVGKAFDVTARRTLLDRKIEPATDGKPEVTESGWSITLKNAGTRPAEVLVRERIYGGWTMLNESLPHTTDGADTVVWTVPVPARGETLLTWRVQVR